MRKIHLLKTHPFLFVLFLFMSILLIPLSFTSFTMALEGDKEKVVQELRQRIEEMEKQRQREMEEFKRMMEEQDR